MKWINESTWLYITDTNHIKIKVHRYRKLEGWFLSCHSIGIENYKLENDDIEKAKNEAIAAVREGLKKMISEIEG